MKNKYLNIFIVSQNRGLTPINEASKDNLNSSPSVYSWLFQHTTQIVELALRILFTKQIENFIGKPDDLKVFFKFNLKILRNTKLNI